MNITTCMQKLYSRLSSRLHIRWSLDCQVHFQAGMALVVAELQMLELNLVDLAASVRNCQCRKSKQLARELLLQLRYVVGVDMAVADGVHELAGFQVAAVSNQPGQQCVAGDVERHAQTHVGRALVQVARQLVVANIKLDQHVARRQRHQVEVRWVPCGHDDAAAVRVGLDLVDDLAELVDALVLVVGVHVDILGAEMPPLDAVHRAQVADLAVVQASLVQKLACGVGVPDPDVFSLPNQHTQLFKPTIQTKSTNQPTYPPISAATHRCNHDVIHPSRLCMNADMSNGAATKPDPASIAQPNHQTTKRHR